LTFDLSGILKHLSPFYMHWAL